MLIMKNQDKTVQSDPLKQNISSSQSEQPNPNPGNPAGQPPSTDGPQFGFTKKDGSAKGTKGWFNRYGSSVILPIIALLILAGGIYLYASQKSQEETVLPFEEEMTVGLEEGIADLIEEPTSQEEISQVTGETAEETIEIIVPEGRKEAGTIIEKAIKGDGATHLARRALKDYLKDNPQELTNEHKVYIEDYLKDNIGSRPLEIDEEISFSEDLIKEAIDASSQLTPEQLKVIEKYSALVIW